MTRVSELLVLPVEGHTIGMVNNLELDGFSDDILPGTLGSHTLAEGAVPSMVEDFFGSTGGHRGLRSNPLRHG